jgi:hypothetical protein
MYIVDGAVLERWSSLSDEQIVAQVVAGQTALYELLMRRHNDRLYRAARAILRDDREAEDLVQHAYLKAYANLRQFDGHTPFATWLTPNRRRGNARPRADRRRRRVCLPADGMRSRSCCGAPAHRVTPLDSQTTETQRHRGLWFFLCVSEPLWFARSRCASVPATDGCACVRFAASVRTGTPC